MKHIRIIVTALALSVSACVWCQSANSLMNFGGPGSGQGMPMYPGPGPTVLAPGAPPYAMPVSADAVNPHDFALLMNAILQQNFASEQLPMVQAAGLCGWFTCSQCAQLMQIFDFDSNKLDVVRYLAPHLIDPGENQPIMECLSFISDQQTAQRIISAAQL